MTESEEKLLLRYATQWRLSRSPSVAGGQPVHIAEAPESMRAFCGESCDVECYRSEGTGMCWECMQGARAQMERLGPVGSSDGLWTAEDIAREYGMASAAVARGWLRRADLFHIRRQKGTDAKLYDPEQVRRAREEMPGQGTRTDLA